MVDDNFHRTVVLVLEHSADGAVGVVLNRPSTLGTHETLPEAYTAAIPPEDVIHEGGPVDPESVILLADFTQPDDQAGLAVGSIGVVEWLFNKSKQVAVQGKDAIECVDGDADVRDPSATGRGLLHARCSY